MTLKRILSLCLVIALLMGGLMTLASCENENRHVQAQAAPGSGSSLVDVFSRMLRLPGPDNSIRSDGMDFSLDSIGSVRVATTLSEGERLPIVGDRDTLLKLLLDRGVFYDPDAMKTGNYADDMEEAFTDSRSVMAGAGEAEMPAPSAAPAPSMDVAAEAPMAESGGMDAGGHSQTNEQVEGVSEGDIVKTDGRYIYAMSPYGNTLRIIKANGAKLEVVSTIQTDVWGAEFYLIGDDRLAIVGNEHVPITQIASSGGAGGAATRIAPDIEWYSNNFSVLLVYDISDRDAPFETRRVSMEGWGVSTRVIGDIVYMVTSKYIWHIPYDQADSPVIMPYTRDTGKGDGYEPVALDSIYYIPDTTDSSYLLIGAVDVYGDEPFEPEAYLGAGSNFYMSLNAMYVTKERWEQHDPDGGDATTDRWWPMGSQRTDVMRFAISGTSVFYTGMGTVDGSPINQYSMDEYGGYFRIATTSWDRGTYVSVLMTSDMQTVGRTEPLAPGEWMQSMRFMGDMGYIVTFQNVDPLFTVDLSDPYNPKVLGELKIPGFSQYLHPLGDGLLLGIGRDTAELYTRDSRGVETVVGFRDVGMKLSLFDVSDPYDPREIDVMPLGEGWAEVSHNPRALMCDRARNQFGFASENWDANGNWNNGAHIFRVENGRIVTSATLALSGYQGVYGSRLCFIGNTLYFVYDTGIDAYSYTTFEKLGNLVF